MKQIFLLNTFITLSLAVFAVPLDTVRIPLFRQGFHDKIDNEQALTDKLDNKVDQYLQVSKNDEINLQVTDAFFRKVDDLQLWVETNENIASNNEKIRYLRQMENLIRIFRTSWRSKEIKPIEFPAVLQTFESIFKNLPAQKSILPAIEAASYEVAKLNAAVYFESKEYPDAQKIVYLKYSELHPDNILKTIRPFISEPFADSLVVVACKNNPVQLYSYAQSISTPEGRLIHRNTNSMVKVVAQLSQTPNALLYFPFLDDLLSGKNTVENIKKYVGDTESKYDSIGYFKLLVKTEIDYFKRMAPPLRDTPIAMFGPNSLREVLKGKSLEHFIKPINELHDVNNLSV
ncbi:MAG: hypothetical protein H7X88_09090, partial [Gloeobacteraceae cyanobacterium ES-bin-316]|nr:hypothetical protein [Ferruginibacter sp.]